MFFPKVASLPLPHPHNMISVEQIGKIKMKETRFSPKLKFQPLKLWKS
jgi:hypothetical protein